MNTPNHYHDIVIDTCKACYADLLALFHEKGIEVLEVTAAACKAKGIDRCYCTILDQYANTNTEALVETVSVKGNHFALNYSMDGCEYDADFDDIKIADILSIYDCCYNMLTK